MRYYLATAWVSKKEINRSMDGNIFYEEFDKKALVCLSDFGFPQKTAEIDSKTYFQVSLNVLLYSADSSHAKAKWFTKKTFSLLKISDFMDIDIREATFTEDMVDFCNPWRYDGRILSVGNMSEIFYFSKSRDFFRDWVCKINTNKNGIFDKSKKTIHSYDLTKELDRIYNESKNPGLGNTPVHYVLAGTKQAGFWDSIDILCTALNENKRTKSKHIIHLNFDKISLDYNHGRHYFASTKELLDSINDNFASLLSGNVIIIEYGIHDEDANFDSLSYTSLCRFIDKLKPYFNNTTVVYAIPYESSALSNRIKKLSNFPLVDISINHKLDVVKHDYNQILKYACEKVSNLNLKVDEKFKSMLKESLSDKSFNDIDFLIEKWRCENLITDTYPQYTNELNEFINLNKNSTKFNVMEELNELIGLKEVKQHIENIITRYKFNHELEKRGKKVTDFSMHMAFMGSPGTGKTVVAKLYGQILKEIGFLSEGRVITVSGSEGFDIKDTFKKAKGSVLFIDEAYALCSHGSLLTENGSNKIATLIAEMENNREDTIVILAGYKRSMNGLLNSNIGFRSRMGCIIEFPDYNQDELLEIFKFMGRKAGLVFPKDTLNEARDILWRGGRRCDQGNARYVRKFFEECIGRQQIRLAKSSKNKLEKLSDKNLVTILPCDLNKEILTEKSGIEQLDELIGLDNVKKLLNERISQLEIQKLRRDSGIKTNFIPMHMAFTGNPGTGKTEVARIVGKILNEKGLLSSGDFYETHPGELLHVQAFDDLFQKARGSVIFIDEAYSIMYFPQILIAELIKNMEDYRDETVVIFAGYTNEIKCMLDSNPGFESRVKEIVNFDDYDIAQLMKIMNHIAMKESYVVAESAYSTIENILEKAKKDKRFGNGRFVRNLLEKAIVKQSARLKNEKKNEKKLSKKQLKTLLDVDFESLNKIKNTDGDIGFIKNIA